MGVQRQHGDPIPAPSHIQAFLLHMAQPPGFAQGLAQGIDLQVHVVDGLPEMAGQGRGPDSALPVTHHQMNEG